MKEHIDGQSWVLIWDNIVDGLENSLKGVTGECHGSIVMHTVIILRPSLEGHLGNNTEVVPSATQAPEQVGIFGCRGFNYRAIP